MKEHLDAIVSAIVWTEKRVGAHGLVLKIDINAGGIADKRKIRKSILDKEINEIIVVGSLPRKETEHPDQLVLFSECEST